MEDFVLACCVIGLVAGFVQALRSNTAVDKVIGVVLALAAIGAGYGSWRSGHDQGTTISAQQSQLASLYKIDEAQIHVISTMAHAIARQQNEISDTRGNLNGTTNTLNSLQQFLLPRDVGAEARVQIMHFARYHHSYRYYIVARPGAEDAQYLSDAIAQALNAGGVHPTIRNDLASIGYFDRISLISSTRDGNAPYSLFVAIKHIDNMTRWQKLTNVPQGSLFIAVGGRI